MTPAAAIRVLGPTLALVAIALALSGSGHGQGLATDPRGRPPAPPVTLEETMARFLPGHALLTSIGTAVLGQGESHSFTQEVEPGVCYGMVALSSSIDDLDLRVRWQGDVVAQDVRPDAYPVVEWCPDLAGQVRVQITAFLGSGSVDYAVLTERNSVERVRGEQDQLTNRLTHLAAISVPRWSVAGPQWRSRFDYPEIQELRIEAAVVGQCYAVLAVGQSSIQDIDLRVLDGDGRELSRDLVGDAGPVVTSCPSDPGGLLVQVAVIRGSGTVAAQVFTHPRR